MSFMKLNPENVLLELENTKSNIDLINLPSKPGIYAIFLNNDTLLNSIPNCKKLLYLGKAEKSLKSRDYKTHFATGKSGSSTVRRSLGALLKKELNLHAIPRSPKETKQDLYNYKFTEEGEINLTNWMKQNLLIGFFVYDPSHNDNISLRDFEGEMLSSTNPLLDLDYRTRNQNRFSQKLMELRKECKSKAEQSCRKNV
jgi:hypothetical protein